MIKEVEKTYQIVTLDCFFYKLQALFVRCILIPELRAKVSKLIISVGTSPPDKLTMLNSITHQPMEFLFLHHSPMARIHGTMLE